MESGCLVDSMISPPSANVDITSHSIWMSTESNDVAITTYTTDYYI